MDETSSWRVRDPQNAGGKRVAKSLVDFQTFLFFCSFFCGNLLAYAFLFVLSHMQSLPSLRELMGSFLYWKSVLVSGLSVGSIGTVIIEWNIFWMSRRNILKNIRG